MIDGKVNVSIDWAENLITCTNLSQLIPFVHVQEQWNPNQYKTNMPQWEHNTFEKLSVMYHVIIKK